jgi:carboxylate-amine ligase
MVTRLMQAGLIDDASKLWWDIRPSSRYPTLEMRVTDVCTRLDDGLSIAALYLCLLATLLKLRQKNQRWRVYANTLIDENRWLAQRYGTAGPLVDFGKGEALPYAGLLEELIELTAEEARQLGCTAEIARARGILARGTSAQRQLQVYRSALHSGQDKAAALRAVVDWLIAETVNFEIPA